MGGGVFCTGSRPVPYSETLSGERCLVETDKPNRCRVTYFVPERRWERGWLGVPPHPPLSNEKHPLQKKKNQKIKIKRPPDATPTDVVRACLPSGSPPRLIMKALTHLHGRVWSKLHSKPHQIRIICECKRLFFFLFRRVLAASSAGGTCSNDEEGIYRFFFFNLLQRPELCPTPPPERDRSHRQLSQDLICHPHPSPSPPHPN